MLLSVVLSSLALFAEPKPQASKDPFRACRAFTGASLGSYEHALCFFFAGSRSGHWDLAESHLLALRKQEAARAWATLVLAYVKTARSGPDAERWYREAIAGFRRGVEVKGECLALVNLASYLLSQGRSSEAEREMTRAERLARDSKDPELLLRASLGRFRLRIRNRRNLALAYRALLESEEHESAPLPLRSAALLSLGNAAHALGRYDRAAHHYRSLEALHAGPRGDLQQLATARFNLANTLFEDAEILPSEDKRTSVVRAARKALDTTRRAGNRAIEVSARVLLGALSGGARGRAHLEACAHLARSIEQPQRESECLSYLAELVAETDPEEAARLLDRAEGLANQGSLPGFRSFAARLRTRVRFRIGPWDRAVEDGYRNLEMVEQMRAGQSTPGGRSGVVARWFDDYHRLSGELLREHRRDGRAEALAQSFGVMERLRSRVLLERLHALEVDSSSAANARSDLASLSDIQSQLDAHEALLSFQVGLEQDLLRRPAGGAWLTVITPDRIRVHPIPDRVRLSAQAPLLIGTLQPGGREDPRPAIALYRALLEAGLAELPPDVRRLVIIPDGILHALPFAALRPSPSAAPLGASHILEVMPSATIWRRWRSESAAPRPRGVLVFADAGVGPPLVHARGEARKIVDRIGGNSQARVGPDASESALRSEDPRRFAVLHFATHAVIDAEGLRSSALDATEPAVLLTPGGDEDGKLRRAEIASLDLRGLVVVLSGCQTASGPRVHGEGVLSLARAFFEAGAVAVVGSRWALRDDDGERFFERFYRALAKGSSVGEAVRRARQEAWAAGWPAEAWAGVIVLGDGARVPFPQASGSAGSRAWAWVAAAGMVLWGAIALGFRQTRSL